MAEEFQSTGNWWEAASRISPSSSSITTFVDHSDSAAAASDPNLHIMGLGLDWNQPLLGGGEKAAEGSFRSMLQPDNMNLNMEETGQQQQQQQQEQQQQQIQWMRSEKLYSGESPATEFKPINRGFSLDHHHHHHHHHQHQAQPQFSSPSHYSSGDSAVTSYPIDTNANLYGNSATLLQGLLAAGGEQQQQPQQQISMGMNFPYNSHFGMNSGELMTGGASWSPSKVPQYLRNSPPKAAAGGNPHSQLQFSNNTAFWNASDMKEVRPSYFAPSYNPAAGFTEKSKNISEVGDSVTTKKSGNDNNQQSAAAKRPRNETPSPLPAFKVRKEKMGDRITALQQLVSPFGKTDTASVLSEAIEYIKFLHEQVSVLSTPYLKSGAVVQQQHQQQRNEKSIKEGEGGKQDLRSRGLCLVPVSSTFPVTHETTVDFWTPTFGGTFR
ncbi:transcription factor bHLH123-like isoform X2 [Cucumis melo]|uniref:Transcription factor bHLH123-like isoform X2 n=1 Tax=Cucumis melo TaxID=3656 RepID=A0ABM3KV96_CUCME|nr:transcription factor bHLH123-like isoform X2 [Cucumis melo]